MHRAYCIGVETSATIEDSMVCFDRYPHDCDRRKQAETGPSGLSVNKSTRRTLQQDFTLRYESAYIDWLRIRDLIVSTENFIYWIIITGRDLRLRWAGHGNMTHAFAGVVLQRGHLTVICTQTLQGSRSFRPEHRQPP
jgi:hypothetical protein